MKHLQCPTCRKKFLNVKLEGGRVLCPHCDELMFVYAYPEEKFTAKEFLLLLDTRGQECALAAAKWFPSRVRQLQIAAAGMFVAWMWPKLALIFKEDAT